MTLIQPAGVYRVDGRRSVYYVEGRYWYATAGEFWYVSDAWGGPRIRVDIMDVPPAIRLRPQ